MEQLIETTKGDLIDDLPCTYADDQENPVPLPAGETFKLRIYKAAVVERDYTVVDQPSGTFKFVMQVSDTDTAGTFPCDIVKINAAGKESTFRRFYLLVHDPEDK